MVLICPYCDIEISEKLVEAEDGCCPECGTLITATSVAADDDEEGDEYEEDEFANEFADDDFLEEEYEEEDIDFGDLEEQLDEKPSSGKESRKGRK
ncbi:MAG: hypothetical protein J5858_05350 [Lentisphaeria bacterium]|nr:hypothetical protein [Lentisphaeria bacterium]